MSYTYKIVAVRHFLTTSLVVFCLLVFCSCGGSSSSSPPPPPPPPPTLVSVTVAPSNPVLTLGSALQFTATANYSDHTTRDITASATWSIAAASVVTVANIAGRQGVVTPRGVGSSAVIATYNSISGDTTATVNALVPRFVLAGNSGSNCDHTVSRFTINSSSGMLRAYGYTPVSAPCPFSLVIDPQSKLVYLASDFATSSAWAFSTDPQSGTLTEIPGSPFAAGPSPTKLAVDPGGRFLFVTNRGDGSVSVFSIGANGALSSVAANVPSGHAAWAPAVEPMGKFLYVTNALDNTVSAFSIASSGALTPVTGSPYPTGAGPMGIVIDPSGQFLYVTNNSSSNVSAFTINGTTGALTAVTGSPFTAGQGPGAAAIDPSGNFLMVANGRDNTASVFSIDAASGALSTAGAPAATDEYPIGIAFDPAGKFVLVSHLNTNDLGTFAFNSSTGELTPVALMSGRTGPGPLALINASSQVNNPIQYMARNLYVADTGGAATLSALKIDPNTGALSGTLSDYNTGGSPATAVATNLGGTQVYSANLWSNNIGGFTVDSKTGTLTAIAGSPFTASNPYGIGIDPSSRFFYAADYNTGLRVYSIDSASGALAELAGSPFVTDLGPIALSIDPAGRLLYVLNSSSASISGYLLDPLTGVPTPLSSSPYIATTATGNPRFMVIDGTGRYLYVVICTDYRGDSYTLLAYAIDSKTGSLTPLSSSPITTGKNPVAVVEDPTGRWLYVGADAVYGYAIAPDGSLTAVPGSPGTIGDPALYLTFEASGKYLYVGNDKGIIGFIVDPTTGALTAGPSLPFPNGKGAWAFTSTFDVH